MSMQRGFSIIEVLVTISITAVLLAVSVNAYASVRQTRDPLRVSYIYSDALKQAIVKARAMDNDLSWGVRINSGAIVVFSGTSYATRATSLDKTYSFPTTVTATGITEVVFNKFSGRTVTSGTTTFSNSFSSKSVTLTSGGAIQ